MWKEYVNTASIEKILALLADKGAQARIVAGGTDLVLEMRQGLHQTVDTLIDISRVKELSGIVLDEKGQIHIGAGVSHNQCLASDVIKENALPLALACWEIGAPQVRNSGTVVGNLVTASPANDTIVPLIALDAELVILSTSGHRTIKLRDFYTGVRKHVLKPNELVSEIVLPAMTIHQSGTYLKLGLRKAQAISLVSMAVILTTEEKIISSAKITLGAVAPTIIHAEKAESFLVGKKLSDENIKEAANLAMEAARPINDIRSSAAYRQEITRVLTERALRQIKEGNAGSDLPESPILLRSSSALIREDLDEEVLIEGTTPIVTRINGKEYSFFTGHNKTLLHLLRDEGELTGSKVGCEEGECGACTIFLDGQAIMSCLVPAPRAHQAEITTIEGIGDEKELHPVQESFIKEGAVQCGYCTPGFIMSATKLLEEVSHPTQDEIKTAISGNLCRCTGYYKIVRAIEETSNKEGD